VGWPVGGGSDPSRPRRDRGGCRHRRVHWDGARGVDA
jgi:hypothetical protein